MGRIGLKAIVYFEVATTVALLLGLGLVNCSSRAKALRCRRRRRPPRAAWRTISGSQPSAWDLVLHAFPTSVVDAMARGDILPIVVFATFFGLGAMALGGKSRAVVDVLDAVAHVMFKVTGYVMLFAPIGVFAAIAATVGGNGLGVLAALGKLVGLMYLGLAIFVLIVLGGVCRIIGVPFLKFVGAIREPVLHRVLDRELRGGAAEGVRGDGAVRRAAVHRRVRAAGGIQLQSRRIDAVSVAHQRLRRPVGRRAHDVGPAADDDADADAREQRRRRRAARRARRADGDARPVRTSRSKARPFCSASIKSWTWDERP